MKRQFFVFVLVLLTTSLACKTLSSAPIPFMVGTPTPEPTPTVSPTATPRPKPTLTKTLTPTVTATESPIAEFQFGEIVALDFLRTDWQQDASVLTHQRLRGCTVIAPGGGDFPGQLPTTTIAGFTWLTSNNAYLLKIGDQIVGEIKVDYGEKKTDCRKAAEDLLKTIHTADAYAQAGICAGAPKQRLKVGDLATVLTSSYLRTEPHWAEETRIRLVSPTEKLILEIIAGPVCAIYNKGEYSYWQVQLPSDKKGWMAEGDLNEYYLAPKK